MVKAMRRPKAASGASKAASGDRQTVRVSGLWGLRHWAWPDTKDYVMAKLEKLMVKHKDPNLNKRKIKAYRNEVGQVSKSRPQRWRRLLEQRRADPASGGTASQTNPASGGTTSQRNHAVSGAASHRNPASGGPAIQRNPASGGYPHCVSISRHACGMRTSRAKKSRCGRQEIHRRRLT